jgi:hypothetical protein
MIKEQVYNKGYIALRNFIEKDYKNLEPTCVTQACMNDFLVELSKMGLKLEEETISESNND